MKLRLAVTLAVTMTTACVLSACSKPSAGPNRSALCADVSGVRQLVADAASGLPEASQLSRIQSLESSLTGESVSIAAEGAAAAGTAAANLAVALGNWKTDISLDQDVRADQAKVVAAANQVPGCAGG